MRSNEYLTSSAVSSPKPPVNWIPFLSVKSMCVSSTCSIDSAASSCQSQTSPGFALTTSRNFGIANFPPIARVLLQQIEEGRIVFPRAKWGVFGCGPHQFPMSAVGLAAGCDTLRIGIEDNELMPNGEPAESNHQLIREAVKLAAFFNRRPATPSEAFDILGLNRTAHRARAAG